MQRLNSAVSVFDNDGDRTAVGLTAPTSAGKTVIATAVPMPASTPVQWLCRAIVFLSRVAALTVVPRAVTGCAVREEPDPAITGLGITFLLGSQPMERSLMTDIEPTEDRNLGQVTIVTGSVRGLLVMAAMFSREIISKEGWVVWTIFSNLPRRERLLSRTAGVGHASNSAVSTSN